MAYDFHYTPTGSGAISGQQVLQQTEDAINDLGNTAISGVQEALDKAQQAFTNSANAVDDAQTALNTANNAEGVAIQAQTDVGNLSGTVTNIGNRVTTAEGNISNLQGRMTTAEGNIGNLQGRMTTAEGNIGNLQTAVSTAQATANSAQQTATTARQQSYVLRYSSTTLVASSTNSNSLLDNTDNLKVGDKVIDASGVIYSVTAIDTANSTFTIGTSLIDLAQDSDVVHKSGNETIGGQKTFDSNTYVYNSDNTATTPNLYLKSSKIEISSQGNTSGDQNLVYLDKNNTPYAWVKGAIQSNGSAVKIRAVAKDSSDNSVVNELQMLAYTNGNKAIIPAYSNEIDLGISIYKWKSIFATNYYYGNDNVEFSTKFVTTDTAQTVSGSKTFSDDLTIYNPDTTAYAKYLSLKNQKNTRGSSEAGVQGIQYQDKNGKTLTMLESRVLGNGNTGFNIICYNTDSNNQTVSDGVSVIKTPTATNFAPTTDNAVTCGRPLAKWSDVQTYKINALEPSSLSLPSDRSARVDISSYFTDTSNGGANRYTVPANGYIYLNVTDVVTMHILAQTSNNLTHYADTRGRNSVGQLYALLPVKKDDVFACQWYTTATNVTLSNAYFIPCQGNV